MDDCDALIKRYETKLKELQEPLRGLLVVLEHIKKASISDFADLSVADTLLNYMFGEFYSVIDIYANQSTGLIPIITLLRVKCAKIEIGGFNVLLQTFKNPLMQKFIRFKDRVEMPPASVLRLQTDKDLVQAYIDVKTDPAFNNTILEMKKSLEILKQRPIPPDKDSPVTFGGPEILDLFPPSMRERGSGPREGGGAAAGAGGGAAAGAGGGGGAAAPPPPVSKTQQVKQRVAAELAELLTNPERIKYLTELVQRSRNGRYYEQLHGVGLVRKDLPEIPDEKKPNDGEIQYMKTLPRFSEQQIQRFTAERAALNANPARKQYLKDLVQGRDSRYFDQLRGLVINNLPDIPEDEQPNDGEIQYMKSLSRYTQNVPELGGGRRTRRRRNRKSKSRSRSKKL